MIDRAPASCTAMVITCLHGPEYQRAVVVVRAEREPQTRRHTEGAAKFVNVCRIQRHHCWNPTHHTCCLAAAVVTVYRGRLGTAASRGGAQNRRCSKARKTR